jgi:hypothetical protein
MALLHWYIIPIGIELGFNPAVLQKISDFVEAVETAMTHQENGAELVYLVGVDSQQESCCCLVVT